MQLGKRKYPIGAMLVMQSSQFCSVVIRNTRNISFFDNAKKISTLHFNGYETYLVFDLLKKGSYQLIQRVVLLYSVHCSCLSSLFLLLCTMHEHHHTMNMMLPPPCLAVGF